VSPAEKAAVCRRCGACCATYRVSFYWAEAEACGLPEQLVERINDFYACMTGSNAVVPRCAALEGEVGGVTTCGVYERRPQVCREVGSGDDKCARARARFGMGPI
jgi:hypothetical protein